VGLDGNIDGLVHLSDISADAAGEEAIRNYKKGQEIEATVLAVDAERERISLGIKQLEEGDISGGTKGSEKSRKNESSDESPEVMNTTLGDLFKEQMENKNNNN